MNSAIHAPASAAPKPHAPPAPTVMVVDDSPLCRELVCVALRGQGFAIASAADGRLAMAQLEKAAPSVVLLDNEMPNMNGLEFLRALRADARWKHLPVVMLTTNVSKEVIVEAIRLGISGYLLKERFNMAEMLARVRGALVPGHSTNAKAAVSAPAMAVPATAAPAKPAGAKGEPTPPKATRPTAVSSPNLVSRDKTIAAVTDIASAKTLPGVIAQIASVAASAKANVAEISVIVRQDPVLAARVIQLAASPTYASNKTHVSSIDDAVRIVGVAAVRDLAAGMTGLKEFPRDRADGMDLLRCWQHAITVAAIMKRIVPKSDSLAPGIPHLIGLCHDLCEILLRQKFPSEYSAASDYARQSGVPVCELLPNVFGIAHGELLQMLLENLAFPAVIIEPIKHYTPYAGSPLDAYMNVLPRSLAIADFLAHGMLLTSSLENLISPISQNDCRAMLIPCAPLKIQEMRADAVEKVSALAKAVAEAATTAAAEPDAAFAAPLIESRDVNVLYVRSSQLAELDPVAAALAALAKVQILDRLTKVEELVGVSGLVIASPAVGEAHVAEAIRIRSSCGRNLPILNMTMRSDADAPAVEPAGIEEIAYPLSIRQLQKFISRLKPQA
jgi:CheY-like chemotaxis protein